MSQSAYSPEQIERWHEQLRELAQKPRTVFTKKQAVEVLMEPIEEALKVCSYQEVAGSLQQWGLEIGVAESGNESVKTADSALPPKSPNSGGL